jgi:hypothetical protein
MHDCGGGVGSASESGIARIVARAVPFAVVALLLGLPHVATAQSPTPTPTTRNVTLVPSSALIPSLPGTTMVAIHIDDATNVEGFTFGLTFDPTVAQPTGVMITSFTQSNCPALNPNCCSSQVNVTPAGELCVAIACSNAPSGAGDLVDVTFTGQANGGTQLTFGPSNCAASPPNGCSLTGSAGNPACNPVGGSIQVGPTPTPTTTPPNTPTNTATGTNTPTATNTPTGTPTHTATVTPTSTNTFTPSSTMTPSSTLTPSHTATVTQTGTPTNTPTNTPPASSTPTNTATGTPTSTNTPTKTPSGTPTQTVTNTPTSTPTPTPMPPRIIGVPQAGGTTVNGQAIPNSTPGNNCITIFDCGTSSCGGSNTPIGTGSVDAAGNFTVNVTPLVGNNLLIAVDTCNGNLQSAPVRVPSPGQVPDVNAWGAAFLAASLLAALALRVRGRAAN